MSTTAQPAAFQLESLMTDLQANGRSYHEFLRRESMSAGIYQLAVSEPDRQQPHAEDEVYYVLAGHGAIEIDGVRTPVATGSVLFVPKAAQHRFVDFPDGLTLLVLFAPAQTRG